LNDTSVIDLGDVDASSRASSTYENAGRRGRRSRAATYSTTSFRVGPTVGGLATSCSIFVPGSGHLILGDALSGMAFLTSIAFLGTLVWALLECYERLTGTLALFGAPARTVVYALAVLYAMAAMLHLCSVLHAHTRGGPPDRVHHPFFVGAASLLTPGWGQMLNGCYGKGTFFLASLWVLGAGWILMWGPARHLLASVDLSVTGVVTTLWWKVVLLAVPAVIWSLAVYDAAAFASSRRAS